MGIPELNLVEAMAMIAGASGGSTWLVMHVHIKYITRNMERQEVRTNDHGRRLSALEAVK